MSLTVRGDLEACTKSAKAIHSCVIGTPGGEVSVDNPGGLEYVSCI